MVDVMARFDSIYPFTTENIAGYMNDLDLTGKRIITVTGSADHILNAILKGATDITTFDINPLTEKYMDLKISVIKKLSYNEFLNIFLFDDVNIDYNIITSLDMSLESKNFWIKQLETQNKLLHSSLFNTKYYNPTSKLWQNIYLKEDNYNLLKTKLNNVNINFICTSLKDLELTQDYDYMFLSNISDYLNLMFTDDLLVSYKNLINKFLKRVKVIYFAYLYDIENKNFRSDIDDLNKVKKVFSNFEVVTFNSALETAKTNIKDGVLILKGGIENVRK